MATLSLKNVVKTFFGNIRAVDDLSLEVAHGERIVLAGPSGCGKTTSLRLIAGWNMLDSGIIEIDDRPVNHLAPQKRDVAMVFQHQSLYPHLSVYGNLALGLKLRRLDKTEIRRRVAETAIMLGIAKELDRKPWELSGGQRQRVALGRAIVRRPKIFLLDEPLSHLDAGLREQMRREIVRLQEERLGTTMVYVTHDQTEAMTIGRRIVVLNGGRVQQIADPATLYDRPANRFVASMIGNLAMNFFTGRIKRHGDGLSFESDGEKRVVWPVSVRWKAGLEPYGDRQIVLGVRPEHFRLEQAGLGRSSLSIPAAVEAIELLGAESYLHLRAGRVPFICRVQSSGAKHVGDQVVCTASEKHLYFFDSCTGVAVGCRL